MNNLNLIPFGLHVPSASLADVGSVKKGAQCDCICPSCKTPLIARQGEIKEWHFAHQSRSTEQETEAPCEYSLGVSLRLMIKQLFEEGAVFYLPEYKKSFSVPIPGCSSCYQQTVLISQEAKVQFDDVAIEHKKEEVMFDLVLTKGKHQLYVYITYKERPFPEKLLHHKQEDAIIEFNVFALLNAFSEAKMGQYKEILAMFLASSAEGKKWRFHPREVEALQKIINHVTDNKDALVAQYGEKFSGITSKPFPRVKKTTRAASVPSIPSLLPISVPSNPSLRPEKAPVSPERKAQQSEEAKQALYGALNNCRVLLGSFDASLTKGTSAQETVIGKVDSLSPQYLHRCMSCGDDWKGASNQCSTCQTHEHTRSVFGQ
tara:strand:+ start:1620 stop:2744 length:1125 start_codon:yes stop_codon:yes gene_type:complete